MSGILTGALARLVKASRPPTPGAVRGGFASVRGGGLYGSGRIAGTVVAAGAPVVRRIRCYDVATGLLVGETWSAAGTGEYVFNSLNKSRRYLVVGHDHLGQYNAAVADLVTPEPMP